MNFFVFAMKYEISNYKIKTLCKTEENVLKTLFWTLNAFLCVLKNFHFYYEMANILFQNVKFRGFHTFSHYI